MRRIRKFEGLTARPDEVLRAVLERLNVAPHPFQIVLDEAGRVLGTLTDGDVRRGMLAGATLADPVARCMHRDPKLARAGDPSAPDLLREWPFVPLVDEAGRLVEILAPTHDESHIAGALVMAGGMGSRLGERTVSVPKPLLPVGGKPILEHILAALEAVRCPRIWVSVHYLAHRIEEFLRQRQNAAEVRVVHETQRLGTAGALGILPERPTGPLLVLNGDVLTRVDFTALDAFHRRHNHDATLAVAHHEVQVPYGVVRHDKAGLFQGIDEKPVLRHFVAAGIYYLGPEVVALAPPHTRMDMPELLNEARRLGLRIGLFPIHEYWADVGRPEDLDAADAYHREAK